MHHNFKTTWEHFKSVGLPSRLWTTFVESCKHVQYGPYLILFFQIHDCESQLVVTTNDLLEAFNDKDQVDLIILDFSKAFDMVPHQKHHKLRNYGIDGKLNILIEQFLSNREQFYK